MIAYLDASVILRIVLGQRDALQQWRSIDRGVASALAQLECLRTIDRLGPAAGFRDHDVAARREAVFRLFEAMEVVAITDTVLARAAQPLPTVLGTLAALHLATALLWREGAGAEIVMATHDASLATAARASGLRVLGV